MNFSKYLILGFLATQVACKSAQTINYRNAGINLESRIEEIYYKDYLIKDYVNIKGEPAVYMKSKLIKRKRGRRFRNNPRTDYKLKVIVLKDLKKDRFNHSKFRDNYADGSLDAYRGFSNKKRSRPLDINKPGDTNFEVNKILAKNRFEYYKKLIAANQIRWLLDNPVETQRIDSIYGALIKKQN